MRGILNTTLSFISLNNRTFIEVENYVVSVFHESTPCSFTLVQGFVDSTFQEGNAHARLRKSP